MASLAAATSSLGARLHSRSAAGLADAMRAMNCYYSTDRGTQHDAARDRARPEAPAGQLDPSPERRDLQVEARAHIRVQREVDRLHVDRGASPSRQSPLLSGSSLSPVIAC